ncbi:MAG: hypothetical protein WKF78_05370 [Candidatus Limnocylindrales bacterium]
MAVGGAVGAGGAVAVGGAVGAGGAVAVGGAVGARCGAVAVGGAVGAGGAVAVGGAVGAGGAVAVGGAVGAGGAVAVGGAVGGGGAAMKLLSIFEEQMTSPPPPLADPLHWLIVTPRLEDSVPVAVQVSPTRVPPFAEPLHCVIVASTAVAGNGSQPLVSPSPEPTHWFTVALVVFGSMPTKLLVTWTLQRREPPPPLVDPLHWSTAVTGAGRTLVLVVQAASGSPAAPWHSRTVTVAEPPAWVIVLTIVTSQINPRPPVLSTPLLQVVVAAIVAAATGGVVSVVPTTRVKPSSPTARNLAMRRTCDTSRSRARTNGSQHCGPVSTSWRGICRLQPDHRLRRQRPT